MQASQALGSGRRSSRVTSASHSSSHALESPSKAGRSATTVGVPAAHRPDELPPGRDGPLGLRGRPACPRHLGDVRLGPHTEGVDLADPDLGGEVDQADRRRHLSRRVSRPALPQRELRQAGLDRDDELDVRGTLGKASQRAQPFGSLVEPATRQRQARRELRGQDLVDRRAARPSSAR